MSLSTPEDPDPLLEFSTEPGGVAPKPPDSLSERIEQLERELADSKSQAAALKAEVATLVRAVGDIRKQSSRPQPAPPPPRRSTLHTATAIVGLILGLSIGIVGWKYFAGEGDVAIAPPSSVVVAAEAAPAPVEAPAPAPEPPAAAEPADSATPKPTADGRYNRGLAPNVARVKREESYERGLAPNVARTFVGTLSIDADPGGEVFLNRKSAGSTPLRLTNLRAGSHLIWIEREGYRRFTRVVQVPADQVTRLSAQLEPIAR